MNLKEANYFLLDVFTEQKFGGNQLAIFNDARHINPDIFQSIARELNISETVFLFPPAGSGNYSMRIFTPGKELPTAGHPTVGTGYYLARFFEHEPDGTIHITLEQKIGPIAVSIAFKDNLPDLVTMSQPLPVFGPTHQDKRAVLAEVLSLPEEALADWPIQEVSCGNNALLVPLKSAKSLADISVKTDLWRKVKPQAGDGFLYVFSTGDVQGGDVQGRMFAPEIGIPEDPATGSANGPLAAYLTRHGVVQMPAVSLQGYEMGRPSQLFLDTDTDAAGQITGIRVSGKSVFVGKGTFFLESR